MAKAGAPEGTVLVAGNQTSGRGRMGRHFCSPEGMGVYLSAILRPKCKPVECMHLTCAAAVAMCKAVERVSGVKPGVKWINDLVTQKRKLGGILTEIAVDYKTGQIDYCVVGVGINCLQSREDFPEELQDLATSIAIVSGKAVHPAVLAAAMTEELWRLSDTLLSQKEQTMALYRESCITLGKDVVLLHGGERREGRAVDLNEDGCLVVEFPDGHTEAIGSGEVSVRGMDGYF